MGSVKPELKILKGSEAEYRALFEDSLVGISQALPNGRLIRANKTYARMYGYSSPDQMIRKINDIGQLYVHPEERKDVLRILNKKGFMEPREFELIRRDGTRFCALVAARAVKDSGGKLLYYQATHVDITEQKRVQEDLRKSESLLRAVLNSAPLTIFAMDRQGRFTLSEGKALEHVGLKPGENVGVPAADLYDALSFVDRTGAVITGRDVIRRAYAGETVIVQDELRGVCFENYIGPLIDADGNPAGIVGVAVDITERKRAKAALAASEDKFRKAFYTNPDAISITRLADGSYVSINTGFTKIMGYSEEDIIGRTSIELTIWDDPGDRQRLVAGVQENGVVENFEARFRAKNGDLKYGLVAAALIEIDGRPHLLSIVHDVTDRKRMELALRESEDKFKHVFDYSVIGKSIILPSGEIYSNKALCEMLGYSREELSRSKWQDISHPDDIELTQKAFDSIRAGEKDSAKFVKRFMHKNGSIVWGEISTSLRRDREGQPLYFMSSILDVTERHRAEDKLRQSEERFRQLSNLLPQIVFETDIQGNLTFANQHGLKSFGHSPEDSLSGLNIFTFIAPEDRENIGKRVQEILRGSESAAQEYRMIRKDGNIFPALIHATSILKDGVPIGVRGIGIDITEGKRAEDELRRMAKGLQEKNDELTRFTAAVLHDLRSPLITIQTFQGFLERDIRSQDGERIKKDLDYIRNAADRIGRLFDEIQRLSRIGIIVHSPEDAPLQAIVQEALDLVAGRIAERGVRVDITEEPIVLWGDRMRLVEVFQNLVDNAAKFMGDEPAPRIEIGVEQAGEEMVLFVRDNGIGIAPQAQPMMFSLFKKLDPETEGTGTGLALVRRIVELHGGRIWVESEGPGKGTTFRFTLAKTRRRGAGETQLKLPGVDG